MKIGDKVRFLSEVGGGIVIRILTGEKTLLFGGRCRNGFDIPMPVRECVV